MMKYDKYLAVLLMMTAMTNVAHADSKIVRGCKFEVKARCASGEARVTLANGAVTRVEVDVFWCGQPGHPGYTCTIDSSRGDQDSKWADESSVTLITNASPFNPTQPDQVKVTVGQSISIDLE